MSRPPNPLPRLYRWRSNLIQAPAFFLATALFGTLSLFVSLLDKTGRAQQRIARVWARACVWASGCRLTVRGAENFHKHPVAVYASNHTSYMDTPVVFASVPYQFRILAKKELWSIPFIGWYLNRSGQIPIDTENPHATLSSLGAGVKALRAGMPLFIFPEGRRTPTGELQEFLSGAAYPGHSRPGAAGAHRAQRSLRSAAHSHPAFLSGKADAGCGRADPNGRHAPAPSRGAHGAVARRDRRIACQSSAAHLPCFGRRTGLTAPRGLVEGSSAVADRGARHGKVRAGRTEITYLRPPVLWAAPCRGLWLGQGFIDALLDVPPVLASPSAPVRHNLRLTARTLV